VRPFVAALGNERIYDEEADASGIRRGSTGLGAEAGVELGLTGTLVGEAAFGW
jgi:hypothetical protein